MLRLLTIVICISGSLAAESVKNETAAGRYDDGYDNGYGGYGLYRETPPVLDRNVCDLDASILLVTDSSKHHHHHRAVRVRCSEIANQDDDSCNVCCQHAARRDSTIQNENMYGFLAITNDWNRPHHHDKDDDKDDDDDDKKRVKRSDHHHHHHHTTKVEPTFVSFDDYSATTYYRNVRCVCCAPRRTPPTPIYASYPQQSPPQYGAPAQSPPQYGAPAQSPPQYGAPAQSPPQYSPPAQSPPQYSPPAQSPPQYSPPAQAAPQYQTMPPAAQPVQSY